MLDDICKPNNPAIQYLLWSVKKISSNILYYHTLSVIVTSFFFQRESTLKNKSFIYFQVHFNVMELYNLKAMAIR